MATVQVDAKGPVLIPQPLRKRLHMHPGTTMHVRLLGDALELRAEPEPMGPVARAAWAAHDAGDAIPLAGVEVRFGLKRRKPAVRRAAWLHRRTRSA